MDDDGRSDPRASELVIDDDDGGFTLVEAMEDHMASYDESLYYVCKEYAHNHALYYKQLKRNQKLNEVPLRYKVLSMWSLPFATAFGPLYFGFQCLLVTVSLTQLVLETIPQYSSEVYPNLAILWASIEYPTTAFFIVDMIVHMALLPPVPNDFSQYSRRSYMSKIEFWIDFVSVVPTVESVVAKWAPVLPQLDFLKALRILRFTRVMRQLHAVDQLAFTLEKSFRPLFGPFIFLFAVIVTISGMVFYVERGEYDGATETYRIQNCDCLISAQHVMNPVFQCPYQLSKFTSLPQTLWFCLVTISTVGYGDMVPQTWWGRIFASICILCGNVLTAMPIAIVGSYFTDIVTTNRRRQVSVASKAFGKINAARGGANRELQASKAGSRGAAVGPTCGERLLETLSLSLDQVDLLDPPGVFVHQINAFLKQEFDSVVGLLRNAQDGAAILAERQANAQTDLAFHFSNGRFRRGDVGAAQVSLQPDMVVPLTKPMPYVCGAFDGALRYRLDSAPPRSPPIALFAAQVSTHAPYSASIMPLYPAVLSVNGARLGYDNPTRLLVGDELAVHPEPGAPPCAQYVYMKEEVTGAALATGIQPLTASTGNAKGAEAAALAQRQQRGNGASAKQKGPPVPDTPGKKAAPPAPPSAPQGPATANHIALRRIANPAEYRGVTFAHYNPRGGDERLFKDL